MEHSGNMHLDRVCSLLSWLACLPVSSCLDPFEARMDAVEVAPPPVYRELWSLVEDCSGLSGDFANVRWFVVPEPQFRCSAESADCLGTWIAPHEIYLAEGAANDTVSHFFTARHEILHELLRGGFSHPPVFRACYLMRP